MNAKNFTIFACFIAVAVGTFYFFEKQKTQSAIAILNTVLEDESIVQVGIDKTRSHLIFSKETKDDGLVIRKIKKSKKKKDKEFEIQEKMSKVEEKRQKKVIKQKKVFKQEKIIEQEKTMKQEVIIVHRKPRAVNPLVNQENVRMPAHKFNEITRDYAGQTGPPVHMDSAALNDQYIQDMHNRAQALVDLPGVVKSMKGQGPKAINSLTYNEGRIVKKDDALTDKEFNELMEETKEIVVKDTKRVLEKWKNNYDMFMRQSRAQFPIVFEKVDLVAFHWQASLTQVQRWSIMIVSSLLYYFLYCFPLMKTAKLFKIKNYWMTWVPFAQELIILKMSERSCWWLTGYVIPGLNFIIIIYLWRRIAYFLGKELWPSFLMIIPVINIGVLWYFSNVKINIINVEDDHVLKDYDELT